MASPLRRRNNRGFTLVELTLSIVILGLVASVVSLVYSSGLQALDVRDQRVMLDSCLRSQMEALISMKFDQLVSGTQNIQVNGHTALITWTVQNFDINNDSVAEDTAKQVTVTLEGRSLTTLVVNAEGKIGKIS